ncbi:pilin [Rhodanobacter aciditrophus]|uniref:pilin n=1 Tax=Rhodanobacter aciditrophus TaxID=1623218 RepID=UPI003CFA9E0C
MKSMQKGFTLIELMIVVAIIAILAAIAIPQYQTYVIRSQVTRAMGEASDMKVAVEDCLNNGAVQFATGTNCVDTSGSSDILSPAHPQWTGGTAAVITATLGGHANTKVAGGTVKWTRNGSGSWTCQTAGNITPQYAPSSCPN